METRLLACDMRDIGSSLCLARVVPVPLADRARWTVYKHDS